MADKLEINQADIYFVKNYVEEQILDDSKSKLILMIAKVCMPQGMDKWINASDK